MHHNQIRYWTEMMNTSPFRATCAVMSALAMLSLASPSSAQQQNAAPAAQQAPALSQPEAVPAQAAPARRRRPFHPRRARRRCDAAASGDGRPLKSASAGLRELSPWSMFLSADILVKAVMIGLAFASLVTWTIFIAKMIELSLRPAQAA